MSRPILFPRKVAEKASSSSSSSSSFHSNMEELKCPLKQITEPAWESCHIFLFKTWKPPWPDKQYEMAIKKRTS